MSEPITVELRVLGHSFRLVTTEKEKADLERAALLLNDKYDDEEGEESYQELYEFVRLIPVSLSVGRKKIAVEESSLLKHFHNKQQIDRSVTEANNVVEMFTPHRPS